MKLKGIVITTVLACLFSINATAVTPLDVKVNENYIKTSAPAFIDGGHSMVPLRSTCEALACNYIVWNDKDRKIDFGDNENDITVFAENNVALINSSNVKMEKPVYIIDDTAYIGARFLADALDAKISWNEKTHTVELFKNGITVRPELIDTSYTSDDMKWLAKIVHAEAQGESTEGKIAVANVVLNRTKSNLFPNNIYDVIFDTQFGVQFTPISNGAIYNEPSVHSYHAAKKALFGQNVAGESLYFCNPIISTNFWISANRPFYKTIGNHDFYL